MNLPLDLPRLHLVTDDEMVSAPDFLRTARALLRAGEERIALHLRAHSIGGRRLWDLAAELTEVALGTGGWIVVNDRVDIAKGLRCDGVQLGRRSMPADVVRELVGNEMRIGCSVHSLEEGEDAVSRGADFLLAGTIFSSPTHPSGEPTGTGWIENLCGFELPVIGIGGIGPANADEVIDAGAHGVAVISAVFRQPDPVAAMHTMLSHVE